MKKTLLISLLSICFAFKAVAQTDDEPPKLGVGLTFGGATGSSSGDYPAAIGLALRFELPLSAPVNFVLSTGYTSFISSNGYDTGYEYDTYNGGGTYSSGSINTFVPVQAGLKFFPFSRFFVEGDAGVSLKAGSTNDDFYGKKVAPLVSPSAGYSIAIGSANRYSIDLGIGYDARLASGGGYSEVIFKAVFNVGLK